MVDRGDQRGVAPVVGFVLIFGFLAISFAVYQGIIVPEQNSVAEFQHNQEVHEQLQTLRNAIRNAATAGTEESVAVRLDATYPRRTIARNLGIATGRIETVSLAAGIRVENVTAVDAETADYFGDPTTTIGPLPSQELVYSPFYTRYDSAPQTVYENTVAYNRFDGENVTITDQTVVDGREITLIALSGNLSTAGQGAVSVDTESLSTATTAVAVTDSGGPLNLTIPSRLPAADWEELLAGEMDGGGTDERYVTDVRQTGTEQVSILLEPGVTYTLRLAKVGIGEGATEEPVRYITTVEGDDTSVVENGSQRLVVEVRDQFNNPVSNVTVEAQLTVGTGGDSVSPTNLTTDVRGQASFTYDAPSDVDGAQSAQVTVFYDAQTPDNQSAAFDLTVLDTDGSGAGSGGSNAISVSWDDPSAHNPVGPLSSCTATACRWDVGADADGQLLLRAATSPPLEGLDMEFAVNDSTVGTLSPTDGETDEDGGDETFLTAINNGTVGVYVAAVGGSDQIAIHVENVTTIVLADLVINDTSQTANPNRARFEVTYSVNDPGTNFQNVTVTFRNDDDPGETQTLSSTATSDTISYSSSPVQEGDDYTIIVEVYDVNDNVVRSETCAEPADGVDDCGDIV